MSAAVELLAVLGLGAQHLVVRAVGHILQVKAAAPEFHTVGDGKDRDRADLPPLLLAPVLLDGRFRQEKG